MYGTSGDHFLAKTSAYSSNFSPSAPGIGTLKAGWPPNVNGRSTSPVFSTSKPWVRLVPSTV